MKRRIIYITLLCLFTYTPCFSQGMSLKNSCGQDAAHLYLSENNPLLMNYLSTKEKGYKEEIKQHLGLRSGEPLTLPIVFHIVHNQGVENIADQSVIQSLEHLNLAFGNKTIFEPNTGVDTKIQFCLAKRDAQGNPTTGILRYEINLTDMSLSESSISSIADLTNFPIDDYINIRILKTACIGNDCDFSGFAISGNHTLSSGIFVSAKIIGNSNLRDEVLIHEMRHFLGLSHTFDGGCKNVDCLTDGDKVCDTPPDNHKGGHPCELLFNSCNSDEDDVSVNNPFISVQLGGLGDQPDSESNFMDYSFFSCQNEFTQDQVDRMRWFIDVHYQSFFESKSFYTPCTNNVADSINSSIDEDSILVGSEIIFEAILSNTDSISWLLDGQIVSNTNFIWIPEEEGIYEICLIGYSDVIACVNDTVCQSLNVFCDVEAKFDFQLSNSLLSFQNCSSNYDDLQWEIFSGLDLVDLSQYSDHETFIYDRWGNLIGHLMNADQVIWDGTKTTGNGTSGIPLEQGVFVFVVKFDKDKIVVGDITLIR